MGQAVGQARAAHPPKSESEFVLRGGLLPLEVIPQLVGLGHDGQAGPALPDLLVPGRQTVPRLVGASMHRQAANCRITHGYSCV